MSSKSPSKLQDAEIAAAESGMSQQDWILSEIGKTLARKNRGELEYRSLEAVARSMGSDDS